MLCVLLPQSLCACVMDAIETYWRETANMYVYKYPEVSWSVIEYSRIY